MNDKKKVLSLTTKDFKWEYFKASGKGGQNKNKRDTAVRVTHPPSGAVGYSCDERSQRKNKEKAFKRMAESEKFQRWVKIETIKKSMDLEEIEKEVDKMMKEENLKIEYFDN